MGGGYRLPASSPDLASATYMMDADRLRISRQAYMRKVALGSIPRARPRRIEQKVVYHLGRIGTNLNQLARIANTTGRIGYSQRLAAILNELTEAIRRLV